MRYLTLANVITVLRLLIALAMPFFSRDVAFVLAIIVIIADMDGAVARWLNQVTPVGAVLDKVTDAVFVTIGLLFFAVADTGSAILVALLLSSRVVKVVLMRSKKKFTHASRFTKATYVVLFVFVLASIHIRVSLAALAVMTALLWIEVLVSVLEERKAFA